MGEVMSKLGQLVTALVLTSMLAACGSKVSFRNSGDEQDYDDVTSDVPCVQNCEPDPTEDPKAKSEVFFQTPRDAKIDILFIDDNSGSMEKEQRELGGKFESFIGSLKDL